MNAAALERFLARLYADAAFRRAFLEQPLAAARAAGLDERTAGEAARIDREGLAYAAASYEGKRASHARKRGAPWLRRS